MNTEKSMPARDPEDVIVLGTASVETKGGGFKLGETMGEQNVAGIAED